MPEYQISYSLVDSMGRPGKKTYDTVSTMVDHAAAVTAANSHAVLLDDVCEMKILSHTVSLRTVYSDSVDAGANKDEGATVTVRKTDNLNAVHRIPAPVQSLRLADGTVDLTDAALIAYFANFEAAGDLRLSDGESVATVVRGTIDI